MPLGDMSCDFPLGDFRGKALQEIETSCHEGILNVNMGLEDGYSLELTFRIECCATAKAVRWVNGDSTYLRSVPLKRPRKRGKA